MTDIYLMALRHSAFYAPYLMTMAGGYLEKAGLNPHYCVQTPDNLVRDRLLDGSCQVSQSAVAASFASLETNQPDDIRHFAQINSRDGFFIASRRGSDDFDWEQLKGQQVLVDHFFQPLAMFKYALYKQGVEWDQLEIIDAGDVDQIDKAFRQGSGDYVHQQGPAPQQMEYDGVAKVVASVGEAIGPVAFSSLCAHRDWLATDMAKIFYQAYRSALTECQQSAAAEIARQLHSYGFLKEINIDVLQRTISTYQALGCWNHSGEINRAEFETLLDVFLYSHEITERYDYDALIQGVG